MDTCRKIARYVTVDGVLEKITYTCIEVAEIYPIWREQWIKREREDINNPSKRFLDWDKEMNDCISGCNCLERRNREDKITRERNEKFWGKSAQ